jgi:F-type H+-transporting ATPase subunit b
MPIDWFTVGAQVVNFLILVWLLKRFLYRPILNAVDAREKRIAAELADAEGKRTEAQGERDDFKRRNEAFDRDRAKLLSGAADEAEAERRRLGEEARKAADALSARLRETLRNEQQNLKRAIGGRVQQEVFAIARKVLADLAGKTLEERMVAVFLPRLRELAGEEKGRPLLALKASPGPIFVRTAFDLPLAQREVIESAVKEILGSQKKVLFDISPGLIGGIELTADGQKVVWSIEDYLASLEKGIGELLKEPFKPQDNHGT